jgi:hypothetical protein
MTFLHQLGVVTTLALIVGGSLLILSTVCLLAIATGVFVVWTQLFSPQ